MMIKPKQPLNSKIKSAIVRKPSLPIKRTSSVQSNVSDQSCMSDRIIYKKPIANQSSNRPSEAAESKNYLSNTFEQQKSSFINASEKSLKKIKNKLSAGNQIVKKNQHSLTGFQWLIVMRHCYHIENKRRLTNCIKQRTLINYIRNRVYPDSLWNKILMMDNQVKLTSNQIIATIQKQNKWKLTLDDILVCVSKNFIQNNQTNNTEEHESAAQTARFTQNMKNNVQIKVPKDSQLNSSQPKFIYKKIEDKSKKPVPKKSAPQVKTKQIEPMSTSDMNQFKIDPQLNISPISINDQTNNVSFSMEETQQPSQFLSQQNSILDKQDRFQAAFNGIQALKQNLQNSSNALQKITLANFLQQILAYSIYKHKQNKLDVAGSLNQSKKGLNQMDNYSQRKQSVTSTSQNQYFYGLKLQNRKSMQKIPVQVLQKLFGSKQFTQYFHNLQAIKISQYYNQVGLAISVIGTNLRILNLSNNNIKSVGFLRQLNTSSLEFININNNKVTNISELLIFQRLQQIHAKNNSIDHVSSDKVNCRGLRILDLGYNQISKQEDLWSLANLINLAMVNLIGNPLMNDFKSIGVLPKNIIVEHTDIYLFSSYTQYKDIAFQARQKDLKQSNRDLPMQSSSISALKGKK